jgi:glycerol-3-phosphate dehydrogenase (NAD(P)+)
MQRPIAILGAGNMASALALALAKHGRPVRLYCIERDVEDEIRRERCNTKYLAGHAFPENVTASDDLVSTVNQADVVFIAVPSFAVAEVLDKAKPHLAEDAIIASISKGLDPKTLQPLIQEELRLLPPKLRKRVAAIGGPAVATEMAKGSPTAFLIACRDKKAGAKLERLLASKTVKVALTRDLVGVGLAAALKNVYAIALGLCDGLGYPTNAKALVLTLAVEEMAHLLAKAGAHPSTAMSLAGLGDLVVTGLSPHGRNRTYGEKLVGATSKLPSDLGLTTVEGIAATKAGVKLAAKLKAHAPLMLTIDRCLRARDHFHVPFVNFLEKLTLA